MAAASAVVGSAAVGVWAVRPRAFVDARAASHQPLVVASEHHPDAGGGTRMVVVSAQGWASTSRSPAARRRPRALAYASSSAIRQPPAYGSRTGTTGSSTTSDHRVRWQLDVDRGGPLGPGPGQIEQPDRDRYQRQRAMLQRQVQAIRQQRGLEHAQRDTGEHEHYRQHNPRPAGSRPSEASNAHGGRLSAVSAYLGHTPTQSRHAQPDQVVGLHTRPPTQLARHKPARAIAPAPPPTGFTRVGEAEPTSSKRSSSSLSRALTAPRHAGTQSHDVVDARKRCTGKLCAARTSSPTYVLPVAYEPSGACDPTRSVGAQRKPAPAGVPPICVGKAMELVPGEVLVIDFSAVAPALLISLGGRPLFTLINNAVAICGLAQKSRREDIVRAEVDHADVIEVAVRTVEVLMNASERTVQEAVTSSVLTRAGRRTRCDDPRRTRLGSEPLRCRGGFAWVGGWPPVRHWWMRAW